MPTSTDVGTCHRVDGRFGEAGVVFRAERGSEGRHEWTTLDGQKSALACRVDRTPSPVPQAGGAWISSLLNAPVIGFSDMRTIGRDDPKASALDEGVQVAELARALLSNDSQAAAVATLVGGAEDGKSLALQGEAGWQFAAEFDRRIDDALAAADLAFEAFDPPAGVRTLRSCADPAVVGLPNCFAPAAISSACATGTSTSRRACAAPTRRSASASNAGSRRSSRCPRRRAARAASNSRSIARTSSG
ncbi:MAG: hypothetical protein ACK5AL_16770 [Planctomycetota bacterium]|jgi:hypothetical protein